MPPAPKDPDARIVPPETRLQRLGRNEPRWGDEELREARRHGPGYYLLCPRGTPEQGNTLIALTQDAVRIGRSLGADIRFEDPTVSRRHAVLIRDSTGMRIIDDRSLTGVFVNGNRVVSQLLEHGDEITLGRYRLVLLAVDIADALVASVFDEGPDLDAEWLEQIGPVWTEEQLMSRFSIEEGHRSGVAVLTRTELTPYLLALTDTAGQRVFPDFQFDEDGQPYPDLEEVLAIVGSCVQVYTLAAWFTSPQPELGDQTPARWLAVEGRTEPLLEVARRLRGRMDQ